MLKKGSEKLLKSSVGFKNESASLSGDCTNLQRKKQKIAKAKLEKKE